MCCCVIVLEVSIAIAEWYCVVKGREWGGVRGEEEERERD